ncbi:MAG: GspH/FimT family pseudopilin [Shewanella sp.]
MHIHRKGFSLIELITVLVIAAILATIGVPSFVSIYDDIRASSSISRIQQTLQFARNAAINYGSRVTVCPIENNKCTSNWQKGFAVFTDTDPIEVLDSSDKIIRLEGEFNSLDFLNYNRSSIRFQADGLASGTNGTFKYCPRTKDHKSSRAVIVNQAGRVRISTASNINCN